MLVVNFIFYIKNIKYCILSADANKLIEIITSIIEKGYKYFSFSNFATRK
jgi:hypothetical protein